MCDLIFMLMIMNINMWLIMYIWVRKLLNKILVDIVNFIILLFIFEVLY